MAENVKAQVFGLDQPESDGSFDDITSGPPEAMSSAPSFDFSGVDLKLADEDLDAESDKQTFLPIPQWTRTHFRIHTVRPSNTRSGAPRLSVDFEAVEDTWGKGKKIRYQDVIFHSSAKWNWGAFLKATGLIQGPADVTQELLSQLFANPDRLRDVVVSAVVLGYSWKKRPGTMDPDFPRSYGENAQPVPTDGTPYFEELGKWAPAESATDQGEGSGDMSALAEFATSSLNTYL